MPKQSTVVTYHVQFRPRSKKWAVVREGGQRPTVLLPSQRRAKARAVKLAKRQKPSRVIVYNRDGAVVVVVPVQSVKLLLEAPK